MPSSRSSLANWKRFWYSSKRDMPILPPRANPPDEPQKGDCFIPTYAGGVGQSTRSAPAEHDAPAAGLLDSQLTNL